MTHETVGPWRAIVVVLVLALIATTASAAPTLADLKKYQDQLIALGEKDKLLKEFRDRVAKSESALNRFLLGRVYVKLQQVDKAQPEFERALELDPFFGPACQGLAICHLQRGEIEGAIRELERAVRADPKDTDSKLMLAELMARTGRRAEAEKALDEVLVLLPTHTGARFLLARVYLETQRMKKARDELRVVLQQDPRHLGARQVLAACLGRMGDLDGAETELRQVIAAQPKNPEPRIMLAEILMRARRFDDARSVLKAMLDMDPTPEFETKLREALEVVDRASEEQGDARTLKGLVGRLKSEDVNVRRDAMRRLSKLPFTRIPREIKECLLDEDEQVRVLVIRMIGGTEDRGFLGVLAVMLGSPVDADESRIVRGACVEALGQIPGRAAVPVLLAALDDDNSYVRELTIRALRERTGKRFSRSSPAVVAEKEKEGSRRMWWGWWASDGARMVKLGAIEDIRKTGFKALVRYVLPLLDDADVDVFKAALAAFTDLTKKSFGKAGDDPASRAAIAKQAREWWKAGGK